MDLRTDYYKELDTDKKKVVDAFLEKINGFAYLEVKAILLAIRKEVEAGMIISA